jgi:hypothetical protein
MGVPAILHQVRKDTQVGFQLCHQHQGEPPTRLPLTRKELLCELRLNLGQYRCAF